MPARKENKLVVSETPSSTWHYHLRLVGNEGIRLGGWLGLKALCGEKLGWDTKIPVTSYDPKKRREHICDGIDCKACYDIAKKKGWL